MRFNSKLNGVHIYDEKNYQKGFIYFDGNLLDKKTGKIIKTFDYKYLGVFNNNNYYVAQKAYEKNDWALFKDNKLIFKKSNFIHHEILFTKNNSIITSGKEIKKYRGRPVGFDTIFEYDLKGNLIDEFSIYDNLKEFKKFHKMFPLDLHKFFLIANNIVKLRNNSCGKYFDYYHLNCISIIPKNKLGTKDKRFQKDNLIISFRNGSLIYILDNNTKKIVYSLNQFSINDQLQGQHSVKMLENGNLLIFDNGRYRSWSRIIELNPITLKIEWEYKKDDFFTKSQGYIDVLENDNYLITESEKGRVFELRREEKKIVWEYYYPVTQDENNSTHKESFGKRQWIYRGIQVK